MADDPLLEALQAEKAAQDKRVINVPEWNCEFCVWPVTLKQMARINEVNNPMLRLIQILRVRAQTQARIPFFTEAFLDALAKGGVGKFGPVVVARVAGEIMEDIPRAEDVEKN